MGQPNGTENGKHGTPQGEDIPEKFRNGFPLPEKENIGKYIEIIKAKIGTQLGDKGDNDIVLGVNEAHYTIFNVKSSNPHRNNILDNHIAEMEKLGYHYSYWV